jgi:DNA repair exonuclease SbcCD ATPase subunit
MEEEPKKRINIKPLPQKAVRIENLMDMPPPSIKKKNYTYTPTPKQKENILKAIAGSKKKKEERMKAKEEREKRLLELEQLDKEGRLNVVPISNEVNSSTQQITLSDLDNLKKEMAEIKRYNTDLETLLNQFKDVVLENKRDYKEGDAVKVKYPAGIGNSGFVPGKIW